MQSCCLYIVPRNAFEEFKELCLAQICKIMRLVIFASFSDAQTAVVAVYLKRFKVM